MNYRQDKYGNDLSILGFGCMRFQRKATQIDLEEMEKEVLYAIEQGVNYFDTAYIYPGSEAALGKVLEKNNLRNKVYIATKLPHYLARTTWVSGSPKRQLYSMTLGPLGVIIRPKYRQPLKVRPSAFMAAMVGRKMVFMHSSAMSAV